MSVSDRQILELNPWWRDPGAIERDPTIRALSRRRLRWDPPALDAITLGPARVHTLRGPRQVGKSTTAKRLIQRLLESGERRVLYFSFDLSRNNRDIAQVVRRARVLHPSPDGPWHLFLDEVTTMRDWQMGVKFIVDNGPSDEDFILCTGSSARKVGSERLPGRKGEGRHFQQLPLSFGDFCRQVHGLSLPAAALSPSDFLTSEGLASARTLYLDIGDLERSWRVYRSVGGFPAAVEDYLREGSVSRESIEMLWDIVSGDVLHAGRDDVATLKLLERVNRSLGSPLSWHALAQDMGVSQTTAKQYVRALAESFVLTVVYFWDRSGKGLNAQRQRKVYFIDPLIGRVPSLLVPGSREAGDDALRESLVATGLFRSGTDRLVQSDPLPGAVCFWKSGRGTETDFVIVDEAAGLRGDRLPIEVKAASLRAIGNARRSMRAAFGRGLVVSESVFEPDHDIPALPVPVFLALLKERPERRPLGV